MLSELHGGFNADLGSFVSRYSTIGAVRSSPHPTRDFRCEYLPHRSRHNDCRRLVSFANRTTGTPCIAPSAPPVWLVPLRIFDKKGRDIAVAALNLSLRA